MPGPRWAALVVVGLGLGCAESAPPPPAYALRGGEPAAPARWQQFCEQAANAQQASFLASSRGNDGWELVSMYAGVLCYKRPVQAAPVMASQPAPVMYGQAAPQAVYGPPAQAATPPAYGAPPPQAVYGPPAQAAAPPMYGQPASPAASTAMNGQPAPIYAMPAPTAPGAPASTVSTVPKIIDPGF